MLTEEEFLEAISRAIRTKRNLKKLSCEKLAELSDVDYSSLNLIENRKQTPRSYTLYKILYALDIDILNEIDTKRSVNDELLYKIAQLDETAQQTLLDFLNGFSLKTK